MTDKEFEKMLKDTPELSPRKELKDEILARAYSQMDASDDTEKSAGVSKEIPSSFFNRFKKWIPLAACFVLAILVCVGFWGAKNENYQTFYIDVNPSLEISLNRFDTVSQVNYLNSDAEKALMDVDLIGCSPEEALELVVNAFERHGYFADEAEMYISTANEDEDSQKLLKRLKNHAENIKGNKNYNVNTSSLSKEEREEAKELGISPGKYNIISKIIEKLPSYSVEDLKDLPMSELKKLEKEAGKNNK